MGFYWHPENIRTIQDRKSLLYIKIQQLQVILLDHIKVSHVHGYTPLSVKHIGGSIEMHSDTFQRSVFFRWYCTKSRQVLQKKKNMLQNEYIIHNYNFIYQNTKKNEITDIQSNNTLTMLISKANSQVKHPRNPVNTDCTKRERGI